MTTAYFINVVISSIVAFSVCVVGLVIPLQGTATITANNNNNDNNKRLPSVGKKTPSPFIITVSKTDTHLPSGVGKKLELT